MADEDAGKWARARAIAAEAQALREQYAEHQRTAALESRFRGAGPAAVLRMFETGTNEKGQSLWTLLEGIVGEGVEIGPDNLQDMRPSEISFHLTKRLLYGRYRKPNEPAPMHLFYSLQRIVRRWLDEGYLECTGNTRKAMVTYREIADKAVELIDSACQRAMGKDKGIKAILDPYNPHGSTAHVSFNTTKETLWTTAPDKSHVNYVVCDSEWEAELARVVEAHPRVKAYVKNQGLQFVVPYRDGGTSKKYLPDFIVQVDDGNDDPLNIVVETKGYRRLDAQLKAETIATQWVPGVNSLGTFGRWAFAEFRDVYEIEKAFAKLVDDAVAKTQKTEKAA